MVVAVALVRMVKVVADEVVDVIAVRHRLVAAVGAVRDGRILPVTPVIGNRHL